MSASTPMTDEVRQVTANLSVGARLFASAIAFFFISFVFAFFYLKAVNSNGNFHPKHVNPQQAYGIAILICVLGATAGFELARRRIGEGAWRSVSVLALVLGVAVVVLQIIQYLNLFKTATGGYASVFWGWTLVFVVFWLGALYWLETLVAQTLRGARYASREGGEVAAQLLGPSASGCAVLLYTLAGTEIVAYILLYLVK